MDGDHAAEPVSARGERCAFCALGIARGAKACLDRHQPLRMGGQQDLPANIGQRIGPQPSRTAHPPRAERTGERCRVPAKPDDAGMDFLGKGFEVQGRSGIGSEFRNDLGRAAAHACTAFAFVEGRGKLLDLVGAAAFGQDHAVGRAFHRGLEIGAPVRALYGADAYPACETACRHHLRAV